MHKGKLRLFWSTLCERSDLTAAQQRTLLSLADQESPQLSSPYHERCSNDTCPRVVLARNASLRPEVIEEIVFPEALQGNRWNWFVRHAPLSPSQVHLLSMGRRCPPLVALALVHNPSTLPRAGAALVEYLRQACTIQENINMLNNALDRGDVPLPTLLECPLQVLTPAAITRVIQGFSPGVRDVVWEESHSSLRLVEVLEHAYKKAAATPQELPAGSIFVLSCSESLQDRLHRARTTVEVFAERLPADVALEVVGASSGMFAQGVEILARLRSLGDMVSRSAASSLDEARAAHAQLEQYACWCVEEVERLAGMVTSLSLATQATPSLQDITELLRARTLAFQEVYSLPPLSQKDSPGAPPRS